MSDLEIVKLCAEAMEPKPTLPGSSAIWGCSISYSNGRAGGEKEIYTWVRDTYDPLHDDAQAMALVKKFDLQQEPDEVYEGDKKVKVWVVTDWPNGAAQGEHENLNRAICECVANMQRSKP